MLQSTLHTVKTHDNDTMAPEPAFMDPMYLKMYTKMLSAMPSCNNRPPQNLQQIVRESFLYSQNLKKTIPDFFGHRSKGTSQTFSKNYFDLVVVMVVAANTVAGVKLTSDAMLNMLGCTLINWELDDFIEKSIDCSTKESFIATKRAIDSIFDRHACIDDNDEDIILTSPTKKRRHSNMFDQFLQTNTTKTQDLILRLKAYTNWQLSQLCTIAPHLQTQLSRDLHKWYISEIQQIYDSKTHYSSHPTLPTAQSLNTWLHGNGHIHAGFHPLYTLLIAFTSSQYKPHPSPTPYINYLLAEHLRQVAIKERLVNDLVSLKRDREEKNLCCFDFPDFILAAGQESDGEKVKEAMKMLEEMIEGQEDVCEGIEKRLDGLEIDEWCAERVAVRCLDAMIYIHRDVYRMVK